MKDQDFVERAAGWVTVPLSEAALIGAGNSAPQKKELFENGRHPFIRTSDVGQIGFGEIGKARDLLNDAGVAKLRRVTTGAILMPKSGASTFLNHRVQTTVDAYVSSHLATIEARKKKALPRYLLYYLATVKAQDFIQDHKYPSLTLGVIGSIPVPLPPLEEQKRIVAVLDQAFAALDRARAHAEANLADAAALYDNWIATIFDSEDAPDSECIKLGAVCRIQSGAGFPVKEQGRAEGQYPFYKVSDMNLPGNEWWLRNANNYIDEPARKRLRAAVFPEGSIVFPKVGGAIITNKKRIVGVEGCVDNNVMGLIADNSKVLPEYLYEWLYSINIYDFSNKANPPSITQGTVAGWPLRVPAPEKQAEIVDAIKAMRAATSHLRKRYARDIDAIADLRQSLLRKAFSGQLTE